MANDVTTTQPISELADVTSDGFKEQTGITREHASRITNATLSVIGAAMPGDTSQKQVVSASLNILTMAISDLIASTVRDETDRLNLYATVGEGIKRNGEGLAAAYKAAADFQQFAAETASGPTTDDGAKVAVN